MREQLEAFITDQVGVPVTVTELSRIRSVGNAREPFAFTATWSEGGRVIERRCVLLRQAAAGQLEVAMRTEFDTLAALDGADVAVPEALWIDETADAFGAPFFVTGWVAGSADTRVLRRPEGDPAVAAVARQLAEQAARLHQLDIERFGHLAPVEPGDAAAVQLEQWEAQFRRQRLEAHPALVYVARWLGARLPVATRVSLVHGDLRFGNLLYEGDRLTALLDWEMTHLGDPIEDLGWVYRSLWTPERSLPFAEFIACYEAAAGCTVDPEHLRWYQVFAELKHAVISLTGTRSFHERRTLVLRHADRAATVPPFIGRALDLIEEEGKEEDPC